MNIICSHGLCSSKSFWAGLGILCVALAFQIGAIYFLQNIIGLYVGQFGMPEDFQFTDIPRLRSSLKVAAFICAVSGSLLIGWGIWKKR